MAIKNRIINKLKKIKADYEWRKLMNNANPEIRKVAGCIAFVKAGNAWTAEEKETLYLIDNLRNELENSVESVVVTDYGAGDPNEAKTTAEMLAGTDSKRGVADICKVAASPEKWGELIFRIVREFEPARILELGTSLGISASYQLAALKINNKGEFITIEGAGEVAELALRNFKKLEYVDYSVEVGRFTDVLPSLLSKEKLYDLVFIDGHHDKTATQQYFELLYPFLENKSVLIFDDINWSEGMKEVWQQIYSDSRVHFSVDLGKWGICIVDKSIKSTKKLYYKFPF